LSGIAAVLAAIALLKSGRSDPAEMGTLSTRLDLVRSMLTDNLQRDEARAHGFREEIGGQINEGFTRFDTASRCLREEVTNLVTALGRTTAGSVEQLGQAARLAGRLKGNGRVRQ
jgi:hypothetical protein